MEARDTDGTRFKRKRDLDVGGALPEKLNTESDSQESVTDAKKKPKTAKGKGGRAKSKDAPDADIDAPAWPGLFKSLERTHRALNIVFTFCCTRKHLATTYEFMKPTVETHTKRPLTIEEIARIVAIRPEGIKFAYVDEVMLELDIKERSKDNPFRTSKIGRGQSIALDDSVGGWSGHESLGDSRDRDDGQESREVLFFEFLDGDLKRQVADKKTGEPTKVQRRLRDEELRMPVYGQKQMTELIERRNTRFTAAINAFLRRCIDEKIDPEIALSSLARSEEHTSELQSHS